MPELFEGRRPEDTIRVWVSGCATGEEAYTFAMLLLEEAARHQVRPSMQVFGSDLDARALASAREGRYPPAIEADVNEERLRRFSPAKATIIACARSCAIWSCSRCTICSKIRRSPTST